VTCAPVPRDADLLPEPVVVFEVLSTSTNAVDRVDKNEEYRLTPSIRRYVTLEQGRMAALAFTREPDGAWRGTLLVGPEAILDMPKRGVSIPLAELHADVEQPAAEDADD
jgi:hypothetical protein